MLLPTFHDIEAAAARIAAQVTRTPVLRSRTLDALAGASLFFKCENLQCTGAFKFRGATNAVQALMPEEASRGVVTHSSGNHGAALALAAHTRGIAAHVVVPEGAVLSKLAAIERYGAILHRCAPTIAAREAEAARIQAEQGATLVHPYTDPHVIAGQGTAMLELIDEIGTLDAVIAPVGGGGLIGGSAIVARALLGKVEVFAAEPAGADDAWRSLTAGARVADLVPDTVCDGLRGLLGAINFELLRTHAVRVLRVADADTIAAMRRIGQQMKLIVEPSSAIALAAILTHRECFAGRRVGVILSGGNVDLDALPW